MLTVNRVTLYALLFKFERENIEWPISRTYPNVVAFKKNWDAFLTTIADLKKNWDAFLTTIADLRESYKNPLSSFFKAIEDGDDCLESLSYDSPSYVDGIIYERRGILDVMVDIWRNKNNNFKCRAEIRKKLEADNVKVNSWFASRNPNMTIFIFSQCCDALELKVSEVLEEYERRYISDHHLSK